MRGEISALFIGIWIGVILLGTVSYFDSSSLSNQAKAAIAKCQETLPRNQICIITAIPKEESHE